MQLKFTKPKKLLSLLGALLLLTCLHNAKSQPYYVSTLAGGGTLNDGSAQDTKFNTPTAVAIDAAGNIYVADQGNHAIRKIDALTGETSTLAGKGIAGFANGIGQNTMLNTPTGIVHYNNFIYFTDWGNNRVRAINLATNEVTTLAGSGQQGNGDGFGENARLNQPTALSTDHAGNLFVMEGNSRRMRRINISSREVSTLTDKGFMRGGSIIIFTLGTNISHVSNNMLYLADMVEHQIKQVNLTNGAITVLTGSRSLQPGYQDGSATNALFNMPVGIVNDGKGNLYITERGNHRIRKYNLSAKTVETVAGQPSLTDQAQGFANGSFQTARFNQPAGMAVDANGNLVLADMANHRIRSINFQTNEVYTFAGAMVSTDDVNLKARFNTPSGMAYFPKTRTLYISDEADHVIRSMNINTGEVKTVAGNGESGFSDGTALNCHFNGPRGLALDTATGSLYIADAGNHAIRVLNFANNEVYTIAGNGSPGFADGDASIAMFNNPLGLVFADSVLYVADQLNHRIRKVRLFKSTVVTYAGTGQIGFREGRLENALFRFPSDITADRNGNLYIADRDNNRIRRINIAREELTTLQGGINTPTTIAYNWFSNSVIASSTRAQGIFCLNITVGSASLVVSAPGLADGVALPNSAAFENIARVNNPRSFVVDPFADRVFFADAGNARVRYLTTIRKNTAPSFSTPVIADVLTLEDAGTVTIPNWATNLTAGISATEELQKLSFKLVCNNPGLFSQQPQIQVEKSNNGTQSATLVFKTAPNQNGNCEIAVTLKDDGGNYAGGIDSSEVRIFNIFILPVNDQPVFVLAPGNFIHLADSSVHTYPNRILSRLPGPADELSQKTTIEVSNDAPYLFAQQPSIDTLGKLSYQTIGVAGVANVSVRVRDNGGEKHGGLNISEPQYFQIILTMPGTTNIIKQTQNKLQLFPNPNNGKFKVHFEAPDSQGLLQVYNLQGQLITETAVWPNAENISIDLGKRPKGMYLLRFVGKGQDITVYKFVVN